MFFFLISCMMLVSSLFFGLTPGSVLRGPNLSWIPTAALGSSHCPFQEEKRAIMYFTLTGNSIHWVVIPSNNSSLNPQGDNWMESYWEASMKVALSHWKAPFPDLSSTQSGPSHSTCPCDSSIEIPLLPLNPEASFQVLGSLLGVSLPGNPSYKTPHFQYCLHHQVRAQTSSGALHLPSHLV